MYEEKGECAFALVDRERDSSREECIQRIQPAAQTTSLERGSLRTRNYIETLKHQTAESKDRVYQEGKFHNCGFLLELKLKGPFFK